MICDVRFVILPICYLGGYFLGKKISYTAIRIN